MTAWRRWGKVAPEFAPAPPQVVMMPEMAVEEIHTCELCGGKDRDGRDLSLDPNKLWSVRYHYSGWWVTRYLLPPMFTCTSYSPSMSTSTIYFTSSPSMSIYTSPPATSTPGCT